MRVPGNHGNSNGRDFPVFDCGDSEPDDKMAAWLHDYHTVNTGQNYLIPPTVDAIRIKIQWESERRDGKGTDVDVSAVLFHDARTPVDESSHKQSCSHCGSVTHSGDVREDGDSESGEEIIVRLGDVALCVQHILFIASVFTGGATFENVRGARLRVLFGENGEKGESMYEFPVEDASSSAMLFGLLTRKGDQWAFTALAHPVAGKSCSEVIKNKDIEACLSKHPSQAPRLRTISVEAVRGESLQPKKWRPFMDAHSNPYVQGSFQDNWDQSPVKKRTVEPLWNAKLLDMERVTGVQTDPLQVSVFSRNRLFPDNFMGKISVPAKKLFALGIGHHTYWFDLLASEKRRYSREKVSGRILLHFNIQDVDPTRISGSSRPGASYLATNSTTTLSAFPHETVRASLW